MEHGKFIQAIDATKELFSKYLETQTLRLDSLPRAKAPTIPMSMAVTTMEILNARGILEQLEIISLRLDSTGVHSHEDESHLAEWLAEFEDAFTIQHKNVSIMAKMAPNPVHIKGGAAVAEIQELLSNIKSIEGIEEILSPAKHSWHTQRNRDGALYVEAFCELFKASREGFDLGAKAKITDIIRRRREFKSALADLESGFNVTDLTKIHEKTIGEEQAKLYPNPDTEGGRFTPIFELMEARLDEAETTTPLLEAWRTLSIPDLKAEEKSDPNERVVAISEEAEPDTLERKVTTTPKLA